MNRMMESQPRAGFPSFVLIGDDDIRIQVQDKRWEKMAE
jgi:hypothetical protein